MTHAFAHVRPTSQHQVVADRLLSTPERYAVSGSSPSGRRASNQWHASLLRDQKLRLRCAASNFSSRLQFLYNGLWIDHPAHVSTLAGYAIRRYPAGYEFPLAFAIPAFASCAVLDQLRGWPALAIGLLADTRPQRGFHGPHRQDALDELASLHREQGTISAGPLTPTAQRSSKDVSTTFVLFIITALRLRLHLHSTRLQLFLA